MNAIRGTIQDGKVVFHTPPDWPNGTRVEIEPVPAIPASLMADEEQDDDPEALAKWIAWCESHESILTPEEEAAWQRAIVKQNAWKIANWDKHCRELESLFDDTKPDAVIDNSPPGLR